MHRKLTIELNTQQQKERNFQKYLSIFIVYLFVHVYTLVYLI